MATATRTPAPSLTPTAAPSSTAPRPRGAARREALLQATLTLVADVGADAVTHRRVAETAGLPLASTTYWFDSKEHLLTAALEFAAQRDLARLRAAAAELADGEVTVVGMVAVLAGPAGHGDHHADRGSLMATYTLMLEAARRPMLQELSQRWTDGYLETFGALLRRLGSRRPGQDARLLIAAADGLTIDRLATGTHADFDPRPDLERLAVALLADPSTGATR